MNEDNKLTNAKKQLKMLTKTVRALTLVYGKFLVTFEVIALKRSK